MGNEIIFKDLITLFRNPDRIRIVKEGRDLYVGFLGMMEEEDRERFAGEVVESHRIAGTETQEMERVGADVAAAAGSGGRL